MTLVIMAIGIAIPMGRWRTTSSCRRRSYFPWLVAILVAYAVLIQAMKGWYAKRYGWQ
jgi:Mg2+-importing ATPase